MLATTVVAYLQEEEESKSRAMSSQGILAYGNHIRTYVIPETIR